MASRPFGTMIDLTPIANSLNWGRRDVGTVFSANDPQAFVGSSFDAIMAGFDPQQPRSPWPGDKIEVLPGENGIPGESDNLVIDPRTGKAVRVGGRQDPAAGTIASPGDAKPAANAASLGPAVTDAGKRIGLVVVAVIIGAIALLVLVK